MNRVKTKPRNPIEDIPYEKSNTTNEKYLVQLIKHWKIIGMNSAPRMEDVITNKSIEEETIKTF